jgi:hypothetical protein
MTRLGLLNPSYTVEGKEFMDQRRANPDRRGMGAQSDFIAEPFVPSERYKTQQVAMAKSLIASGVNPDQIAAMFLVPMDLLSCEKAQGENPEDSA